MTEKVPVVKVGDRIQLAEYRGTVRFLGSLQGRAGSWVGIEWDDLFRGKHDGTVDGVRYFHTRDDETSGSFVPLEKFSQGSDLVKALRSRYAALGEEGYDDEDMFVSTTSNKSKRIELVGLNKIENRQKRTELLTAVDLSGAGISHLGELEEVSKLLSGLEELNVAFNFVRSWNVVMDLVSCLPKLEVLNLSGNPFLRAGKALEAPGADSKVLGAELKTLVMNECDITWAEASTVAAWMPRLMQIQVCLNCISRLSGQNEMALCKLEAIDLSLNKVEDWSEVCHLGQLPQLKKLNLTGNPLTSVSYREDIPGFFANLDSFLLGDCAIEGWDSVLALNCFPSLKETRLSGNPFMQSAGGGVRFEIVARVAGLVHLNGSKISSRERIDCERRYISHLANELLQADVDRPALLAMHPRYEELIKLHGEPSTNAVAAKQTGALKENVIEITLTCHAPSAKTMESQKKKVPVNMTLGTLRTLIEKLFTLPKSKMKLFLQLDHQTFPEDITDVKDDRRLGDLYIVDGQEILINE